MKTHAKKSIAEDMATEQQVPKSHENLARATQEQQQSSTHDKTT